MHKQKHISIIAIVLTMLIAGGSYADHHGEISAVDFEKMMVDLSNWGRWGPDDQLGTINFITAQKRISAAMLVTEGISVSMAQTLLTTVAVDNSNPFGHEMLTTPGENNEWAVDRFQIVFHSLAHSHIDSLCHHSHGGSYQGDRNRRCVDAKAGWLIEADHSKRDRIAGIQG